MIEPTDAELDERVDNFIEDLQMYADPWYWMGLADIDPHDARAAQEAAQLLLEALVQTGDLEIAPGVRSN